jgi:hypothetical protein
METATARMYCAYFTAPTPKVAQMFLKQGCRVNYNRVYPPIGVWINSPFAIPIVYRWDGADVVVASHQVRLVRMLPPTPDYPVSADWEARIMGTRR